MVRGMWIGLAVVALPAPAAAKEQAPEVLKRTGAWIADYDDDACHLAAQFGDVKNPVVLRITRYEPSESFMLGLYGRRVSSTELRTKVKLDFGLSAEPIEVESVNGNAGKLKALWVSGVRFDNGWSERDGNAPALTPEREASISGLTVTLQHRKPFRLDFGGFGKAMAQLRACQTHLVKSWGYDPEEQASLSRPARGRQAPAQWLSASDYPMQAVRMGHNGFVQFRLDVDETGKITGCHVLDRTNPDDFADLTCKLVARRAKLEPALNAAGKPVRSYIVQRVTWQVAS
ncbi:TonB family protein [Sphingomonas xinjiangensis]|uniref:TonB family protein n=1 Tax=Sphingomonas xinjiangensis TaxID=643568 RepID=A0A840YFD2_9SPHN|nr:TonB family protein [Sphingomonas xinjiangensis]MBB5710679.1 TonB family protein [Sphingomonas xinjiangensis]